MTHIKGTRNVKSLNQSKIKIVEMECLNLAILVVSEQKWTALAHCVLMKKGPMLVML